MHYRYNAIAKVVAFAMFLLRVSAFRPSLFRKSTKDSLGILYASRRTVLENVAFGSIASIFVANANADPVWASGGATAGGAYLLSAKQRYNDRVKDGVKGFIAIGTAIENGDIDAVRTFFTSEEQGSWKDLTAAGYLLANAFRRNSTASPDSLPSVKKWKAFAAEVEAMTKALKKKDKAGATEAYKASLIALDEYLEKVELPTARDISSA